MMNQNAFLKKVEQHAKFLNYEAQEECEQAEKLRLTFEEIIGLPLTDLSLCACEMYNCDISSSNFSGSDFTAALLVDLVANKTNFHGCNFSDAVLKDCTFEGSVFQNCNFTKTELIRCDFTGADISGARFAENKIIDCNGISFVAEPVAPPTIPQDKRYIYRILCLANHNGLDEYFVLTSRLSIPIEMALAYRLDELMQFIEKSSGFPKSLIIDYRLLDHGTIEQLEQNSKLFGAKPSSY